MSERDRNPGDTGDSVSKSDDLARQFQNALGALRDLDEALRLEPGFAEAYFNRSLVRLKREEPSEAFDDLAQAIRLRPSWTAPYVLRAQVRAQRRDRKGAREDARRALDLGAGPQDRRELDALHLDDE